MRSRFLAPLLAAALLAGCARDVVVMLPPPADEKPDPGDLGKPHPTGVVVYTGDGKQVVLDTPYASDTPGRKIGMTGKKDVDEDFAEVLAASPVPPGHHKLYFEFGKDEMTADSKKEFDTNVVADVQNPARKAVEIVIVGYTDRVGKLEDNDRLSLDRANAIRDLLRVKLPNVAITTDGHGERADKDPDETPNPAERYVDIIVQ